MLSEREARGRRRAGVGEPGPGAQGRAVPLAPRLAGRISGVEIQPLVPHFHKGEPVHRRFPPAGAASASRDPLLRWPLGVLAGVRPSPAAGAGRAARRGGAGSQGIVQAAPPPAFTGPGSQGKRGAGALVERIQFWSHTGLGRSPAPRGLDAWLCAVAFLGPRFPYL